jgi:adenylate cyclase
MKNSIWTILRNFFLKRKLRFEILSSFFFLQIMAATFIIAYMHNNHTESLYEFSDTLMKDISEEKIESILHRFKTVENSISLGSNLVRSIEDVSIENDRLVHYMISAVKQSPYVDSIFIALKTGLFLQVRSLPPGSTYRANPTKLLPKNAAFGLRIIINEEKNKKESWHYLDSEGRTLESEKLANNEITFDFKTREWYNKALDTQSLSWSNIYIFSITKLPGIAASYPLQSTDGKYIGVIGSDIHIKSMSEILQKNSFSGLSMIMNRKGEVIAHPTEKETAKIVGTEAQLVTLEELPNKLGVTAYKKFIEYQKNRFTFDFNGEQYIANYSEFNDALFKNWTFCSLVPINVFVGKVKETQHRILIISFLILFSSTFIMAVLAHRISRPIQSLVDQANRIRNFDLSNPIEVNSSIVEIQKLQIAISRMRSSLEAFAKFIPKTLVRRLIEKGTDVRIGGKSKRLTVFFSDIAGFTTISETFPADKLMTHLSEYFDELTGIVLNEHGTIDKYIGDAIMAFWGAPNADRMHALHACKTALFCQKRLTDLNRKWLFEKVPPFYTRIGLHTGDAIVGNLGSSERMNYTILGDTVNLAARLEGVNKQYGTNIIISQAVFKEVQELAIVRPLDIVSVKGKNEGVAIYELVALQGTDPLLLPTSEQLEFCENFKKGFTLYLEQRWDEAIPVFHNLAIRYPEDIPTQMYIERCKHYKKSPPGEGWDGVNHLHSK